MAHAGAPGDRDRRALTAFFDVLGVLVDAGVTAVAEAAFQDRLWRPGLTPLLDRVSLRVIRCTVDPGLARDRVARRLAADARRAAHDDRRYLDRPTAGGDFGWITLPVPTLRVATGDGYDPPLDEVLAFVNRAGTIE
jgi:predicted kinase